MKFRNLTAGIWVRTSALTLVAFLVLAGCGKKEEVQTEETQNVVLLGDRDVSKATRGNVATGVVLTGSLEPYLSVEVRAQVPGVLRGIRLDRGQTVRQGTVLATIEAEGIRNAANSAQAAVAIAQSQFSLAQQQFESAKTLHDAGAMSDLDFKTAQTGYEAAQNQLEAARAQAVGAKESASRTVVTAPLTGVISARTAENGEAINPGESLFTLVNTDQLELYGHIPVESAARIRVGQEVTFTMDAYPGQTYRGAVARIEPTADPNTRQIGVFLRLPNPGGRFVGGIFATGRIIGEELKDVVTIPASALSVQGGTPAVFVVNNGRVERRPVTVGGRDEQRNVVAVASGLKAGETILSTPSSTVPEGAQVRLASEVSKQPAAKPAAKTSK